MLLVAALSACSGSSAAPEREPTPAPSPLPSTPSRDQPVDTTTSTGGLDVRYLDDDGAVKTVKVRSFPR